jgi:hypothetical protein
MPMRIDPELPARAQPLVPEHRAGCRTESVRRWMTLAGVDAGVRARCDDRGQH